MLRNDSGFFCCACQLWHPDSDIPILIRFGQFDFEYAQGCLEILAAVADELAQTLNSDLLKNIPFYSTLGYTWDMTFNGNNIFGNECALCKTQALGGIVKLYQIYARPESAANYHSSCLRKLFPPNVDDFMQTVQNLLGGDFYVISEVVQAK
jgi:hypothetical protein